MTKNNSLLCAAALLLLSAPSFAQTGGGLEFSLVGGYNANVTGSKEKFQEYRGMRDGFLFYEMQYEKAQDDPFFMEMQLRNGGVNALNSVGVGSYGKWSLGMSYDTLRHNFNEGTLLLDGAGGNRLTVDGSVQTTLQASEQTRQERGGLALVDTTGEDATQQGIVRGLLANKDETSFGLDRRNSAAEFSYNVTPDVKAWVKARQEVREGSRQLGVGTYERYAQGAAGLTHTEDQFVATGLEIAEPVNYRTKVLNAGAGVYKKGWLADLEYSLTDFDNGDASLIWANPFRSTDLGAKSATGTNNNAYDRGRFVNGQLSLPPSSRTHDVSASGSVELPLHGRLSGSIGYGVTTQNDRLLPYTLNTGIAGIGGAPANVTDVAALPVARFDGEIRTVTQSYALNFRPAEKLGASVKYRYYDYDNRSEKILFPGYAAYGESYWRTAKNAPGVGTAASVQNETASYTRQTASVGADYGLFSHLTVDAEAFLDSYDHREQRVAGSNESGVGAGFHYRPSSLLGMHGSFKTAHRRVNGYKTGNTALNPEAVGLANFNWAERARNKADLRADVSLRDNLTVGLAGQYQNDKYAAGKRFGFKSQRTLAGSLDASYEHSEKLTLSASWTREGRKSGIDNGAKDDAFNVAGSSLDDGFTTDNFNPFNYWNTDITEKTDTVGFETLWRPSGEKVDVNFDYSYSESRTKFDTSNPNADAAVAAGYSSGAKLANAAANVWPTVVGRLHELRTGCGYKVNKDMKVGLSYLFSWYKLRDFANVDAYQAGLTPENTTKYVMTGANKSTYEAHLLSAYMSYKF